MSAWKDAPAWVFEAAKLEDWQGRDWEEWERLRVRFVDLGFELETTGSGSLAATGSLIIAAHRKDHPRTSIQKKPDQRLLDALHLLCLRAETRRKQSRGG